RERVRVQRYKRKISNLEVDAIAVRLQYFFNYRIHRAACGALKISELDDSYRRIQIAASITLCHGHVENRSRGFLQKDLNLGYRAQTIGEFLFQFLLLLLLQVIRDVRSI